MTPRLSSRLWRHHLPLAAITGFAAWLLYVTRPYPDALTRLSFSTAWPALVLLTVTLMIGPWRGLTGKLPVLSLDLRRDIVVWAGLPGVAHAVIGQCVHLRGRNVDIVGYIAHRSVASSNNKGSHARGGEVILVGPGAFLPEDLMRGLGRSERDFDAIVGVVNAIVLLRIQRERFSDVPISDKEYIERYRLDSKRLGRLRDETIVMHPGPYNRGVELDDSVLEYSGWRYAKQVTHGVGVRMAILDFLVNGARSLVAS